MSNTNTIITKEKYEKIKFIITQRFPKTIVNRTDYEIRRSKLRDDFTEMLIEETEALTSLVKEVREEEIATEWLLGDDTGSSSKAICRFMLGIEGEYPAPFDVADRGRCIRLLNSIPKWWNRLDEMASLPSIKVNVFSSKGMEIREDGWRQQIPLIKREAADLKSK